MGSSARRTSATAPRGVERQLVSSGAKWEPVVGYSRAVRVHDHVYVSGTTATGSDGTLVGKGDPYTQAKQALENIERALQEAGSGLHEVVRTRIFTTRIDSWSEIGRAHIEKFRDVRPACTMVEVSRLIAPELLVEIEAEAVSGPGPNPKLGRPGRLERSGTRRARRRSSRQ